MLAQEVEPPGTILSLHHWQHAHNRSSPCHTLTRYEKMDNAPAPSQQASWFHEQSISKRDSRFFLDVCFWYWTKAFEFLLQWHNHEYYEYFPSFQNL